MRRMGRVLLTSVAVFGCGTGAVAPGPGQEEAGAVYFGRSGSVFVTAGGARIDIPSLSGSMAGGTTAFEAGLAFAPVEDGNRALVGSDICEGATVMEWSLGIPSGPSGVILRTGAVLAADEHGSRLAVWEAMLEGQSGVAIVERDGQALVNFLPDLRPVSGGMVAIPSSEFMPEGGVAVLGNLGDGDLRVWVVDALGTDVASTDAEQLWGATDELWQVLPEGDGSGLVIAGERWLSGVRLPGMEVEWTRDRVGRGWLAEAEGSRLLLTDGGRWPDDPGSGLVFLMDSLTGTVDTIDVSTPLGGLPGSLTATVSLTAVVSKDGSHAFVVTGTPARGPLYPVQPPRVLVLDVLGQSVRHVVDVSHLGLGAVGLSKRCQ